MVSMLDDEKLALLQARKNSAPFLPKIKICSICSQLGVPRPKMSEPEGAYHYLHWFVDFFIEILKPIPTIAIGWISSTALWYLNE